MPTKHPLKVLITMVELEHLVQVNRPPDHIARLVFVSGGEITHYRHDRTKTSAIFSLPRPHLKDSTASQACTCYLGRHNLSAF